MNVPVRTIPNQSNTQGTLVLTRSLLVIMALACGMTVANVYFNQSLLADIMTSFRVPSNQAGLVATFSQIGYATGILFLVPLGDLLERRRLIISLLSLITITLILAAVAPNVTWLIIASFCIGSSTVVPQIVIPFAASLATDQQRGQVVGTVQSGLLVGILLARAIGGFVDQWLGWYAMYWIAAAGMLILAVVLAIKLPRDQNQAKSLPYTQLLRSLAHFIIHEPVLRQACLFGALIFGAFSAFWTTLTFFLDGPPYHYSAGVIGLFGLLGAVTAAVVPLAGRLVDRFSARAVNGLAMLIVVISFIIMLFLGNWLIGLILTVILLDVGTQSSQVANQTRIFALHPEARSRLNTIYMVATFLGGSLGSWLGANAWNLWHSQGVSLTGLVLVGLAIVVYLLTARSPMPKQQRAL